MAELNRIQSTPLAYCNGRALISASAADCSQRIHPSLPIQELTLLDDPGDYAHKSACLDLGPLGVSVGMGSPFRFEVEDHAVVTLLLSCGGQGKIEIGGQGFVIEPGQPALYLPGEAYSYAISKPHGVVITTQVERIAAQALALAEQAGLDGIDLSLLQRPLAIGPTRAALSQLLKLMRKTLSLLDVAAPARGLAPGSRMLQPGLGADQGLPRAGVHAQDDSIAGLICRQIAAMVYPQLVEDRQV